MCDASGASSVQLTSTAHGLAAMISTAASGLGAQFTCHDIQPLPDEVEFLAAGLVDHMHVVLVPILLGRGVRLWDGLESLEKDYQQLRCLAAGRVPWPRQVPQVSQRQELILCAVAYELKFSMPVRPAIARSARCSGRPGLDQLRNSA
jgi:hypothetical protein